jgi:AcrR family transcriptional regulator
MTSSARAPRAAKKSARTPKTLPRPYHHGNLRAALLDAAEAVLAERGAGLLTLRDVARAAGVSHAAPYHHFASLDALLAAVAQRGFEALGIAMADAVAVSGTRERMLRVTQAYVAFARSNPERFRLMFGPLLAAEDEHPALKAAARQAFGIVLAAAVAHDPRHGADLAVAGWSLAHGLSHLLIDGALLGVPKGPQPADTLARRLAERLLG